MEIRVGDIRLKDNTAESCRGWVLQKYTPAHTATRNGRHTKIGDNVPERWSDWCYPFDLAAGLEALYTESLRDHRGESDSVAEAIKTFKACSAAVVKAASMPL